VTYRILSPALVELAEAAEYYESKAPGLGGDFIREAERVIPALSEHCTLSTLSGRVDGLRLTSSLDKTRIAHLDRFA
jgi:hypothetical protein